MSTVLITGCATGIGLQTALAFARVPSSPLAQRLLQRCSGKRFRELSHAKTVFQRHRFYPIDLFYPPYGNAVQKLVLRLWLGKGDPALQPTTSNTH